MAQELKYLGLAKDSGKLVSPVCPFHFIADPLFMSSSIAIHLVLVFNRKTRLPALSCVNRLKVVR